MDIAKYLQNLEQMQQLRTLQSLPQAGGRFPYRGRTFFNFSSNDYLDLAKNQVLKEASQAAISLYGCSASSSRLLSGHLDLHQELEDLLAAWTGYPAALVFGSGFLANIGVLSALLSAKNTVFFDRLNHASLIDGLRFSGAKWQRYKHKDMQDLESRLAKASSPKSGELWVISDSLFSMDGDFAPLRELMGIAGRYGARVILDEAHSMGVFGPMGSGYFQALRREGLEVPALVTANFSKALGSYGGFCLCSEELRSLLINRARSFIYSTGLAPACLAAAKAAIELLREDKFRPKDSGQELLDLEKNSQQYSRLGAELMRRAEGFHRRLSEAGLPLLPFESPILLVLTGESGRALELASGLEEEGIIAKAIRPPTVPDQQARIRLSVTLAHSENDLEETAEKISKIAKRLGLCAQNEEKSCR